MLKSLIKLTLISHFHLNADNRIVITVMIKVIIHHPNTGHRDCGW